MMDEIIQDYCIKSLIREEAMGTVYLGVHLPSNTKATIRLINPCLADEVFYHNLSGKNNALVSLNHPSIGKFYKYVKKGDHVYLISEYVPNTTTLLQYLEASGQAVSKEKIWHIFMQIIDAFEYAHSKGLNHFAVNPQTIRILGAGQVKILDFGVAGLFINHLNKGLPKELESFNTQYSSPEHVLNKGMDLRSDIYSLGVILFELLTGQVLYPSALLASEVNNKIINDCLPPIKTLTHAFAHSYTMQAIVNKATAKHPSTRFQHFQELKVTLLEEKDERGVKIIHQLMQKKKAGRQLSPSEKILISKLARQRTRVKPIVQALLVLGLMAGTVAIGVNIHVPSSKRAIISLDKEIKDTNTISSHVLVENTLDTKPEHINEHTSSPVVAAEKSTPDTIAILEPNTTTAFPADTQKKVAETATSRAGFAAVASPGNNFSQVRLQNRVEAFYASLRTKDLSQINTYYAPTLTRFFNERNVDKKQLQNLLLMAWERTPEDKHEILWDTFQYFPDPEGNVTLEFYMNYVYRRANKGSWRSQKIYTKIKMDNNLKIYYMSGD